ncbi:hypothetical protein [Verminephrobacter eiseniae]|uniref:hypothetical protein n=1 Tax=Verminephrobacter eiseniae TaxID=364317 RepID=UPI002238EFAB|nr:hypothetical protein [Verminephrobacter eiseniae]MCW5232391.1 hypothetical protein [Verminephrobacter eiseniae]MCW5296043.1 hypothetical protein [Verminephrobacter eiseniae]MCW8185269.1 hypothetical protein [Verminephrobacter eiseniae]MCW8224346.1 hypothetical protein [Verminephrobacter eiseniae]MCW8235029.1 hypothetical protein [Verminephrobacter eiseniae]
MNRLPAPRIVRLLVSRHRSSVGLGWPSKRIAALHRLPIQLGMGKRCALRCAPMAARSLRHLTGDATLAHRLPPRRQRQTPDVRSSRHQRTGDAHENPGLHHRRRPFGAAARAVAAPARH